MDQLLRLHGLARVLRLPYDWLRDEAHAGRIPCLKVGRKFLFSLEAVEATLAARAGESFVGSGQKKEVTGAGK